MLSASTAAGGPLPQGGLPFRERGIPVVRTRRIGCRAPGRLHRLSKAYGVDTANCPAFIFACSCRLFSEEALFGWCVRGEGVQGVLTLICGGVAQTCHDDRVVELKEQLGEEEVDGEGQEGKVKEEGRGRIKENAPWMTMQMEV